MSAVLTFSKGAPLAKVAGDHCKYKLTVGAFYIVDDGKCHAPCAEQTAERHADDHAPAACTGGGLLYINSVYCIDIACGGHSRWVVQLYRWCIF